MHTHLWKPMVAHIPSEWWEFEVGHHCHTLCPVVTQRGSGSLNLHHKGLEPDVSNAAFWQYHRSATSLWCNID
jgi:hypothetical protein